MMCHLHHSLSNFNVMPNFLHVDTLFFVCKRGNVNHLLLRRFAIPRCSPSPIVNNFQTGDLVEQLVTLVSLHVALLRLFSRSLDDLDAEQEFGKYSQVEEVHDSSGDTFGDVWNTKRNVITKAQDGSDDNFEFLCDLAVISQAMFIDIHLRNHVLIGG